VLVKKNPSVQQSLGQLGEHFAAEHLERLGLRIVERNYRSRYGEIDLIASNDETLVFCEVKTRRVGSGKPFDSLHNKKQDQVRRMAVEWCTQKRNIDFKLNLRFDAIGITVSLADKLIALEHLEAAF
jgi:putative endonuclease